MHVCMHVLYCPVLYVNTGEKERQRQRYSKKAKEGEAYNIYIHTANLNKIAYLRSSVSIRDCFPFITNRHSIRKISKYMPHVLSKSFNLHNMDSIA